MSQQQTQNNNSCFYAPTGSVNTFNQNTNSQQEELGGAKKSSNRQHNTNHYFAQLYEKTYKLRPGERMVVRTSGRKNKNEILGLTLALLIKEKYLYGAKYSRDLELFRGIQTNTHHGEFVLVLRTDGRIVAMSDDVEHHLGKKMRQLYTQCINIFECLDSTDGNKLQVVLSSSDDLTNQEQRIVCTFRLPKGKRPSRTQEDVKMISMAGHFFSCDETSNEKLFIARCEALVSRATNSSSSSQTAMINNNNTNSVIKLTLSEDMSINIVSSNVKDILGYSRNEMIGNWLGRYLATSDLEKFESIRQRYFQHEQQPQQLPTSICDVFDMYTNNGNGRLTFLCQIRPIRERRSKIIKFSIVAQLVDPSIRNEYIRYVQTEFEAKPKPIKAEQVNLGAQLSSSIPKKRKDTIMATHSPSLANGLLTFDNANSNDSAHQQQYSPFHRSLSNFVAPIGILDEPWEQLFEFGYTGYPPSTTGLQYWPTESVDDAVIEPKFEPELADIFDEYIPGYYTGGDCC